MNDKKIAIVTGASRGIGRAIALKFAQEGMRVVIIGRDEKELKQTATLIKNHNDCVMIILSDLTANDAAEKIKIQIAEKFGRLDYLVNNAGCAISKPFEKHTQEDWDTLISVNAKAPFFLTQALLPLLRKSSNPAIINISSAVGRVGYPEQSAYSASKHALMGWSKALAKEVQKDGIRVHVIAPGGVATDLITRMRPDIKKEELLQTEDIAQVAFSLVSLTGNAMIDEINIRRYSSQPWQ